MGMVRSRPEVAPVGVVGIEPRVNLLDALPLALLVEFELPIDTGQVVHRHELAGLVSPGIREAGGPLRRQNIMPRRERRVAGLGDEVGELGLLAEMRGARPGGGAGRRAS